MNKTWFTGIGFGIFLCIGALIYTTIPQARPSAASTASNKNLENLQGCATDKNPAFLANVINGALMQYDKIVKAAVKSDNMAEVEKARKALLHVISFLLKESQHFSPIYKDVEHQPKFDKAIDSEIQKMFTAEHNAAKDPKMKEDIIRAYRAIVKELKTLGVAGLTTIKAPKPKPGVLDRIKGAAKSAGRKIKGAATKGAAGIRHAEQAVAAKFHRNKTPVADDDGDASVDDVSMDDDGAVDDGDAPVDDDDAPVDDGDAPVDDDDAPVDDDGAVDDGEYADDSDAPVDDGDAPVEDGDGDDAPAEEDEQYTEED